MAAISKFLFDQEFDSGLGRPRGKGAARPEPRAFTASDVEAAKASAFADGVAAGRAEAEKEATRRIADTLRTIGERLDHVLAESARAHAAQTREAVGIVAEITRKLLPALAKREALAEIEALVSDCLVRVHDEPRLVIRVADDMLDALRQRIDQLAAGAGFAGRIVLLADPTLADTDARVEWADGGADRDVASVWREIENTIQRFVQDGPAAPDPVRT